MSNQLIEFIKSPHLPHIEFKTHLLMTKTHAKEIIRKGTIYVVLTTGDATDVCRELLAQAGIIFLTNIPTYLFPRRENWSKRK